jgi:hypothetical protein
MYIRKILTDFIKRKRDNRRFISFEKKEIKVLEKPERAQGIKNVS